MFKSETMPLITDLICCIKHVELCIYMFLYIVVRDSGSIEQLSESKLNFISTRKGLATMIPWCMHEGYM